MTNYYFLATALPPLEIGFLPDITFIEFRDLLLANLTDADYAKTEVISRYYDIQNIRSFLKNEPIDPYGNFNVVELEEALVGREGLPDYVYRFLDTHESLSDRLRHFSSLSKDYFREEISRANGFLKDYLIFEWEWRLVLTGFRAKELGRDLLIEMQYEDPYDDFVAQIIAQKDAKNFIPPDGYQDLGIIFEEHKNDPLILHKALCEYRFQKIESMLGVDLFSIDRILGYMAQLIMVEKWMALDAQKGLKIVDKILNP